LVSRYGRLTASRRLGVALLVGAIFAAAGPVSWATFDGASRQELPRYSGELGSDPTFEWAIPSWWPVSLPPPPPPAPPPALTPTAAPAPPIGAHFHCQYGSPYYTNAGRAAVLDKLKAAGVTWVRMDPAWSWLETGRGIQNKENLAALDTCVNMTRQRGLNIVMVFRGTPGWANGKAGIAVPPTNPADFQR